MKPPPATATTAATPASPQAVARFLPAVSPAAAAAAAPAASSASIIATAAHSASASLRAAATAVTDLAVALHSSPLHAAADANASISEALASLAKYIDAEFHQPLATILEENDSKPHIDRTSLNAQLRRLAAGLLAAEHSAFADCSERIKHASTTMTSETPGPPPALVPSSAPISKNPATKAKAPNATDGQPLPTPLGNNSVRSTSPPPPAVPEKPSNGSSSSPPRNPMIEKHVAPRSNSLVPFQISASVRAKIASGQIMPAGPERFRHLAVPAAHDRHKQSTGGGFPTGTVTPGFPPGWPDPTVARDGGGGKSSRSRPMSEVSMTSRRSSLDSLVDAARAAMTYAAEAPSASLDVDPGIAVDRSRSAFEAGPQEKKYSSLDRKPRHRFMGGYEVPANPGAASVPITTRKSSLAIGNTDLSKPLLPAGYMQSHPQQQQQQQRSRRPGSPLGFSQQGHVPPFLSLGRTQKNAAGPAASDDVGFWTPKDSNAAPGSPSSPVGNFPNNGSSNAGGGGGGQFGKGIQNFALRIFSLNKQGGGGDRRGGKDSAQQTFVGPVQLNQTPSPQLPPLPDLSSSSAGPLLPTDQAEARLTHSKGGQSSVTHQSSMQGERSQAPAPQPTQQEQLQQQQARASPPKQAISILPTSITNKSAQAQTTSTTTTADQRSRSVTPSKSPRETETPEVPAGAAGAPAASDNVDQQPIAGITGSSSHNQTGPKKRTFIPGPERKKPTFLPLRPEAAMLDGPFDDDDDTALSPPYPPPLRNLGAAAAAIAGGGGGGGGVHFNDYVEAWSPDSYASSIISAVSLDSSNDSPHRPISFADASAGGGAPRARRRTRLATSQGSGDDDAVEYDGDDDGGDGELNDDDAAVAGTASRGVRTPPRSSSATPLAGAAGTGIAAGGDASSAAAAAATAAAKSAGLDDVAKGDRVVALHSFAARSTKEMSLAKGDIVTVHKKSGTWIYGTKLSSATSGSLPQQQQQQDAADQQKELGWIPVAFVARHHQQ
ncbi:hypothetical protein HK405_007719 [Cladochytrium tenue]|nr:hypothetical protein HK405_007719 [Cladochytrium tenue]